MVTQLRPRDASDANDMTVLTLTRDPRGLGLVQSSTNTTTTAVQSSVDEALGYNGFAEVSRYAAKTGASTWLRINRPADAANGLLRDSLGRITSREDTIVAAGGLAAATTRWDYTYDDRGRLATATKNSSAATTYTYDPNGNRTGPVVAHYDPQDRMTDLGGVARTYTNNGSLATRGSEAFTYDLSGNLRKWVSGGTTIEYLIDGQNRRVGKKRNGTLETIWLYDDQLRLAAQLNGAGHVRQVFYYSGQSRTPELVFQPDATPAVTGGGRWFRLVSDLNGSLRLVLDISGTTPTVRQRADYDPWGVVTAEWVDTTGGYERVPFGFAAGLLDTDTALVRFGARDYEPAAGRWTAKDPIRFGGGLNLSGYSGNDPVNRIDPSGLDPEGAKAGAFVGGLICGAVGAYYGVGAGAAGGAFAGGGVGAFPGGVAGGLAGGAGGAAAGAAGGAIIGDLLGDALKRLRNLLSDNPTDDDPTVDTNTETRDQECSRRAQDLYDSLIASGKSEAEARRLQRAYWVACMGGRHKPPFWPGSP